jgi:hypothetical protein
VWLNVLSGGVAIGVYAPESMASGIEEFGDYDTTGELLRVEGTFNAGCDEHGGDLDIHATAIEQTAAAVVRTHEIGWWKLWVGIVALSCAVAVLVRQRRAERRAVV